LTAGARTGEMLRPASLEIQCCRWSRICSASETWNLAPRQTLQTRIQWTGNTQVLYRACSWMFTHWQEQFPTKTLIMSLNILGPHHRL